MSESNSQNNINEIPVAYADIMKYNALNARIPIHTSDSWLVEYFYKYLIQRVFSVYKFNLPEDWDEDYFRYTLFNIGYIGIINTKAFGVIPVFGHAGGPLNVFYRPTLLTVSNPALLSDGDNKQQYKINEECALIKLQPNWMGITDLVAMYADQMAMIVQSFGINIENSHLAYVFAAKNKAAAEAFKKMADKINDGDPVVVYDKNLLNEDGTPAWDTFTQNLKENFIVPDLIDALTTVENRFLTAVGIPNANTDKKERLITDEVNSNNQATMALCETWLETMKKGFDRANKMFKDINISVELRHPLEQAKMPSNLEGGE